MLSSAIKFVLCLKGVTMKHFLLAQFVSVLLTANVYAFNMEAIQAAGTCRGCDFENQNIANTDFSGLDLDKATFNKSDVSGSTFDNCSECDFTGAKAIKLNISGSDLDEAVFNEANMTDAICSSSYLHNSRFLSTDLTNADFTSAELSKSRFTKAILKGTNFSKAKLKRVNFEKAQIENANFTLSKLNEANFGESKLSGSIFKGASLTSADFRDADIKGANFIGADVRKTIFKMGQGFDVAAQKYAIIGHPIKCSDLKQAGALYDKSTKCD